MEEALKTGFWRDKNVEYSLKDWTFSSRLGYSLTASIPSAWNFLLGSCLAFALTLHKTFGYELRIAWDAPFADRTEDIWATPAILPGDSPPSFWDHLVHGYCAAGVDGRTAYIDVRGVTTEREPFFAAFGDRRFYEEARIPPASLERFLLTGEGSREAFQLARALIDARRPDYALFPQDRG